MRNGTWPDEYIERWGDIFVDRNLAARRITFEAFLQAPEAILRALEGRDRRYRVLPALAEVERLAADMRAMAEQGRRAVAELPAQSGTSSILEAAYAVLTDALGRDLDAIARDRRNGAAVEPLHHHRHHHRRSHNSAFFARFAAE